MQYIAFALITAILGIFIIGADLVISIIAFMFGANFRAWFLKGLWALLAMVLLMAYGVFFERNFFRLREVEIFSDNLPESFDGYRIVQLSDIHLDSFGRRSRALEKVVSKVNATDPDMVAVTGDLVSFTPSEINGFEQTLSSIKAKDGVYSVLGNHDYCFYYNWPAESDRLAAVSDLVEREDKLGWKLLMNSHSDIVRGKDTVSVIGVENTSTSRHFPSYGNLNKASDGAEGHYKVLLSHDPTHWKSEVTGKTDIDLTLSGHTHAAQMSLLGWSPSRLLFGEFKGLYGAWQGKLPAKGNYANVKDWKTSEASLEDQYLYVNVGLGETGFPGRIFMRPEITVITLRKYR